MPHGEDQDQNLKLRLALGIARAPIDRVGPLPTAPPQVALRRCRLVLGNYGAVARKVTGAVPAAWGWAVTGKLAVSHASGVFTAEVQQTPPISGSGADAIDTLAQQLAGLEDTVEIVSSRRSMFELEVGYNSVLTRDGVQHRIVLAPAGSCRLLADVWVAAGQPVAPAEAWLEAVGGAPLSVDPAWRLALSVVDDPRLTYAEELEGQATSNGVPISIYRMFTTERFTGSVSELVASLEQRAQGRGATELLIRENTEFDGRPASVISFIVNSPAATPTIETHLLCAMNDVLIEARNIVFFHEKRKRKRFDEAQERARGELAVMRVLCHVDM